MQNYKSYKNAKEAPKEENESGEFTFAEEAVKGYLSKLDGVGEDALLSEVFRRAKEGKKSGELTNDQIDGFVLAVSPSLTPVQQKKVAALAEKLKAL